MERSYFQLSLDQLTRFATQVFSQVERALPPTTLALLNDWSSLLALDHSFIFAYRKARLMKIDDLAFILRKNLGPAASPIIKQVNLKIAYCSNKQIVAKNEQSSDHFIIFINSFRRLKNITRVVHYRSNILMAIYRSSSQTRHRRDSALPQWAGSTVRASTSSPVSGRYHRFQRHLPARRGGHLDHRYHLQGGAHSSKQTPISHIKQCLYIRCVLCWGL